VLNAGSSKVVLDQNVDRLYLSEAPGAYRFQQSGISLNGYAATGSDPVFTVALQNDADGTVLVFPGGTASATVSASGMRIGGVLVSPTAPTSVSPPLGAYVTPPTGPSGAGVFLGQGANFAAASTGLSLYGAAGNESVSLARGVSGLELDQLVERVQFDGLATAGLRFQQQGIGLLVYEGTTLLARVPLQNDADGTLITTADGTMQAKVSAAGMRLGGTLVSPTAPGAVVPTQVDTSLKAPSARLNTSIKGGGTSNAATGDTTFTIAPITSSYTYTITGFGAGDRIVSPLGTPVSIADQSRFDDGSFSVQYASGGNIVKISLTGVDTYQDGRIFSVSDLNAVFGPGAFT